MILKTRTVGTQHIEDEMKGFETRNRSYISMHIYDVRTKKSREYRTGMIRVMSVSSRLGDLFVTR